MPTENKLRVPPSTREDIKAMVEEMNDHVFIDLKNIDLNDYDGSSDTLDNGETFQKLVNLPDNKIVAFKNFRYEGYGSTKYCIALTLNINEEKTIISCQVELTDDEGGKLEKQFRFYNDGDFMLGDY